MRKKLNIDELKAKALEVRRDIITMLTYAGSGHSGGSLSSTDYGTALFFNEMNIDPKNPEYSERDMWFFSIGHVTPVIYSLMAESGYFEKNALLKFRKLDGFLEGHPCKAHVPGIECSGGSLGQGLSVAVGAALGSRMDKHSRRVYAICGDGELQEGQIWEAVMFAAHYKLDNICVFVDYNRKQIDGDVEDIMGIHPLDEKFRSFNWNVITIDGHNFEEILAALEEAKNTKGKPTVILGNTIMGKGVSFMEDLHTWHGNPPNKEQAEIACKELGTTLEEWTTHLENN